MSRVERMYRHTKWLSQNSAWSEDEVIERWGRLFPVAAKSLKNLMDLSKSKVDLAIHREKIEGWRANLANISWFIPKWHKCVA